MTRRPARPSAVPLIPAAAFAVHQLRYLLDYGPQHAGRVLAEQGHGYLSSVVPWLALGLAAAAGTLLVALVRAWRTGAGEATVAAPLSRLWPLASGVLLALFIAQELLEGLVGERGDAAAAALVGSCWAAPGAVVVGLLVALLLRGARAAVAFVARRRGARVLCRPRSSVHRAFAPRSIALRHLAPLALHDAARAPPVTA